ncbi:hypothetical protein DMB44_05460 [Thermoplasma sp. Kam2015]|uniref:hypothetical protein n=1 Tax=Thermoplasma sp. Kam2015 TaxID=2094122 RepID=UPI000D83E80A|nr:hypothetical protein [Thermoplasma sp. Kam2015]PYB68169.1 hypothetical protein DMB44_05460 [Thermoplasma sp. Kam2015]
MKIGSSWTTTSAANGLSHMNKWEFDFFNLGLLIILGIIAWELARKGIAVPSLVWILIEILLALYIAGLIVSFFVTALSWRRLKSFHSFQDDIPYVSPSRGQEGVGKMNGKVKK